ncbi:JAB-like toxin 1 domain-containing protein [Formosa maritima]|uniref:RHS repeat-associated core domain-containing protein n=1 Tax=Formosa maritima TaxID=2592046 RepID=A0A5D0GD08_9FLAO|nr:JAB-like toxin 1 domain-containing protein [Formosa maritima]TYA56796.1 hypothetical protein FVF61_05570 [Formosa maritima]
MTFSKKNHEHQKINKYFVSTTNYLTLLFILSFGFGFAQTKDSLSIEEQQRREKNIQAGNPFKQYGYKPKIATLSKGKYLEFHDLDSIVKIGSFTYHVKRKTITGYTKLEARYSEATLNPEIISRWMSPDPLSDEFPNWSPYNFVMNSPVLLNDPTGLAPESPLNDYQLNKDGSVSLLKLTDDKFDTLYASNDDGTVNKDKSMTVAKNNAEDKTIIDDLTYDDCSFVANTPWGKKTGTWTSTSNESDALNLFKFGSDNSNVEWSFEEYKGNKFFIGNNHFSEATMGFSAISGSNILDLVRKYHSHPGTASPDDVASGYSGDQGNASSTIQTFLDNGIPYSRHPTFSIYRPALNKKFDYSPWNNKFNEQKVKTPSQL